MRPLAIFAATLLGTFAIIPAALAQSTGTRIGPSPAQVPDSGYGTKDDQARVAMYRYAECVVDSGRDRVEMYLATFPGSKAAHKSANSLAVDRCLSTGEMRFSESLFRSGVYDVLYRKKFLKDGPVDFAAIPAIDYAAGEDIKANGTAQSRVVIRQIADCTVRKAPQESRVLVLSAVASKSESTAFTQIVPAMSGCVFEGSELNFSKSVLRGVIGEALYRLSVGASQPMIAAKD
mgnify:CR=1 FL=1